MLNLTLILYAPLIFEARKELWEKLNAELYPQMPELIIDVRETFTTMRFVVEFSEPFREDAKKLEKFCKEKEIPVAFIKMERSL